MKFFKRQELEALKLENRILKDIIQNLKDVIYKLQDELTTKGFQEFERKKEVRRLNKALRRKK